MESVHVVGITVTILISVYYIVVSNQLDRIEEKLNNIQKQLTTQTNTKNDALDVR